MIHKYFGTDGIRGRVGTLPITPHFALKLGWAAGKVLSCNGSKIILIGKDTRNSGYMLESAIGAGISAAGLSAYFTGPIPTPAVAYLTRLLQAEAGIVISASHNPFYDNGIKFFSIEGMKLSNNIEQAIENAIEKPLKCVRSAELGQSHYIVNAASDYISFCKNTFPNNLNLKKIKIIVDCANGSTCHIAPNVLRDLGATVIPINYQPNGININKNCGTTDLRVLRKTVLDEKADIGIAYDGDGDRVVMIDHIGNKVDGDHILYILATEKMRQGKLMGGVVGTIMSNLGLELSLKKIGIPFARVKIGDRYIFEKLQKEGWKIGAEKSGHIILLEKTTTGDGIIAGLQVLSVMVKNHKSLYELCKDIKLLPQILVNIYFSNKKNPNPLSSLEIKQAIDKAKKYLAGCGRVILRQSGTEPLIRIMIEGEDAKKVKYIAHFISDKVRKVINY
ncbi:phosphoglucosamine mutase [Candidatus Schneideria nysicola]|uniref:phosphoglucosamine mutase n=1 Tax=Candidatus Schneideria nysicola TaxID=1081631 RepID=UPI001CAA623D|nr:phosphoglucosamine mutase [Candidatus Schneideria nysicola]UAJ64907.1 phosphoglucosamine mutase [Candidatus Schneideria nysicola]